MFDARLDARTYPRKEHGAEILEAAELNLAGRRPAGDSAGYRVQEPLYLVDRRQRELCSGRAACHLRVVRPADDDADTAAPQRLEGVLVGDVVTEVERQHAGAVQAERG